jgi:spermidine synthase
MPETKTADSSRYLPALLLLFAGSGVSALIYEIVWYQELQLAIGSTAASLGVLLATYMGGLSLGSWLLPRWLSGKRAGVHPLKAYALIELGIGVLGLLELVLIPAIDKLYVAGSQSGAPGMVLRAVFCVIALLPPTMLMGASLPAIARWARSSARGASWWGLLYGCNIAGAVAGCLIGGFFLLRLYDVVIATVAAAVFNAVVGGLSLWLASVTPASAEAEPAATPAPAEANADAARQARAARWWLLIAIGLSGAVSMGAQVVWTRICGLMLGGTVYVFSVILAVFLTGLGFGAGLGAYAGRKRDPRALLGWSQVLAAMGLAWTAWQLGASEPFWPVQPLSNTTVAAILQIDLVRVIWAILPATVCWGASVPLAFAAAARVGEETGQDPSRTVGGIYAANTLGAIVGALAVSLVMIPAIGTGRTEAVLLALSGIAAMAAFAPTVLAANSGWKSWGGVATAAAMVCVFAPSLPPVPGELIAYGRRTAQYVGQFTVLESHEGRNSSIAVTRWGSTTQFHVQGKVEASDDPADMALQRMLGFIPALFIQPKSVLIVGFGAGVTAGTFTTYPTITRIKICEMEPLIPPTTTKYFSVQDHNVLHDPRTDITYDDARHYLATTKEKFDVVTSDPIHPFVKGSASLYSKEYFQMMRDHLNPGGVATQWIPLYESDFPTVKSEIATFMAVFPYAEIFKNNDSNDQGYDVVLIGHMAPLAFDPAMIQARLAQPDHAQMATDMTESGLGGAGELFGRYVADRPGLLPWLADAQINRDRDLRLQYLAGFALNRYEGDDIYKAMAKLSAPPVGIRTPLSAVEQTYTLTPAKP